MEKGPWRSLKLPISVIPEDNLFGDGWTDNTVAESSTHRTVIGLVT
jgi:hypothetical protein